MNFNPLNEADADGGEGNASASPARCAGWWADHCLALTDSRYSGGGDWLNVINVYG